MPAVTSTGTCLLWPQLLLACWDINYYLLLVTSNPTCLLWHKSLLASCDLSSYLPVVTSIPTCLLWPQFLLAYCNLNSYLPTATSTPTCFLCPQFLHACCDLNSYFFSMEDLLVVSVCFPRRCKFMQSVSVTFKQSKLLGWIQIGNNGVISGPAAGHAFNFGKKRVWLSRQSRKTFTLANKVKIGVDLRQAWNQPVGRTALSCVRILYKHKSDVR